MRCGLGSEIADVESLSGGREEPVEFEEDAVAVDETELLGEFAFCFFFRLLSGVESSALMGPLKTGERDLRGVGDFALSIGTSNSLLPTFVIG